MSVFDVVVGGTPDEPYVKTAHKRYELVQLEYIPAFMRGPVA